MTRMDDNVIIIVIMHMNMFVFHIIKTNTSMDEELRAMMNITR